MRRTLHTHFFSDRPRSIITKDYDPDFTTNARPSERPEYRPNCSAKRAIRVSSEPSLITQGGTQRKCRKHHPNSIDSVRQSRHLAEIAVTALKQRPLCDGSVRRAKRALTSLIVGLNADGKDRNRGTGGSSNRRTTSRSWSFGQRSSVTIGGSGTSGNVSKNWSASKQIQAMVANLVLPRGAEASGPAMPIYIMSSAMVLVMWVLVAAVPCQTSSVLVAPLLFPKHHSWASAAVNIQERINEEMKRKEKRFGGGSTGGLMEEMQRMERIGLSFLEFTERFVEMVDEICRGMEVGLEDLQRQVREVFHRLVRSRLEIVSVLDQAPAL